jgi:hypothetical protein
MSWKLLRSEEAKHKDKSAFKIISLSDIYSHNLIYEVVLERSKIVIVVAALVKGEKEGQGHTCTSLLKQSAM